MRPDENGGKSSGGDPLIARAEAAVRVSPRSVADSVGLDERAMADLLAGGGDALKALRLVRALRRKGLELEALADELTEAAHQQLARHGGLELIPPDEN